MAPSPGPGDRAQPDGMELCASCGVAAIRGQERCGVCGEATPADRRLACPAEGPVWVALRARTQCAQCQLPIPIDELLGEERTTCGSCGMVQAFTPVIWRRALERAHDVADMSGGPEGRRPARYWFGEDNPYRELGLTDDLTTVRQVTTVRNRGPSVTTTMWVEHRPGHPLCDHCRAPLRVDHASEGRMSLSCPNGHDDVHTAVDKETWERHRPLLGALAHAHRTQEDLPEGLVIGTTGRVGCASCGAPLPASGRERVLRCEFCGAHTHLSPDVRHDLQQDPEPDTIWVAFEEPSALRKTLERDPSTWQDEDAADRDRRIKQLEVATRELKKGPRMLMTTVAPAVASAIAVLMLVGWIFANQTLGVPLPDMVLRIIDGSTWGAN